MKFWMAFVGLGLAAQPAAAVAAPPTVEELAVIAASDEAKLDKIGIQRAGNNVRFDVIVARRDPAQRTQGEPASREVRYLGRCKDKALALSSVTTNDEYGKPIKRYLVPPGSAEFSPPPAGSQAAEWITQACGRN